MRYLQAAAVGAYCSQTRCHAAQNAEGAILGPFECWLAMRGLKTMALRMRRQAATAAVIARWLAQHPLVRKVNYPGLQDHPGHAVHAVQASAGGSLLSFETGRWNDMS